MSLPGDLGPDSEDFLDHILHQAEARGGTVAAGTPAPPTTTGEGSGGGGGGALALLSLLEAARRGNSLGTRG